jgi:hypothetical protein
MKQVAVLFCVSMCLTTVSSGCGGGATDMPEIGEVHGKITLDGQPLSGVKIYFKPQTGRESIAIADEAGAFEAIYLLNEPGVKIGPCSVTVAWDEESPGAPIPEKYGASSTLTLDVKPGDNEFNIEMVSN